MIQGVFIASASEDYAQKQQRNHWYQEIRLMMYTR